MATGVLVMEGENKAARWLLVATGRGGNKGEVGQLPPWRIIKDTRHGTFVDAVITPVRPIACLAGVWRRISKKGRDS
jgi:hypothetical protein